MAFCFWEIRRSLWWIWGSDMIWFICLHLAVVRDLLEHGKNGRRQPFEEAIAVIQVEMMWFALRAASEMEKFEIYFGSIFWWSIEILDVIVRYTLVIYPIWSTGLQFGSWSTIENLIGLGFGCWRKKIKHVFSLSNVVKTVPFAGIFVSSVYLLWLTINEMPLERAKKYLNFTSLILMSRCIDYKLPANNLLTQKTIIWKKIHYVNN